MKTLYSQAQPWIDQAEHNLTISQFSNDKGYRSFSCFWPQQAAEVALKGFLISEGLPVDKTNSVRELVRHSTKRDPAFSRFDRYGAILDKHYKTSRDPLSLPFPDTPGDVFLPEESSQALHFATEIVEIARSKVSVLAPDESGVQTP